jgi:hypothetical protein
MKDRTPGQITAEVAARIVQIKAHIDAVNGAVYFLNQRDRNERVDTGDLLRKLVERELTEWRNLFMWGGVVSQRERDRINAAGYERFLRDGMSVDHWLTSDRSTPSKWLSTNEQEFREMCRKAFAPREK